MNEELKERLEKAVSKLEEYATKCAQLESFGERITKLEGNIERYITTNYQILEAQGAFRVALKNVQATLTAGMTTMTSGFTVISNDLEVTLGYTKSEIEKMSAKEYREKVLIPLGMGRSWQK